MKLLPILIIILTLTSPSLASRDYTMGSAAVGLIVALALPALGWLLSAIFFTKD